MFCLKCVKKSNGASLLNIIRQPSLKCTAVLQINSGLHTIAFLSLLFCTLCTYLNNIHANLTSSKFKRNLKNIVFWDVSPCGSCRNRRFGRTYRLHLHGENNQRTKATLAIVNMFQFFVCFYPEDGGNIFLQNVGSYNNHTATHPRRQHSS
jgi:amino acid permease